MFIGIGAHDHVSPSFFAIHRKNIRNNANERNEAKNHRQRWQERERIKSENKLAY